MEPRKGAIAYCRLKRLGLITSETMIPVVYHDGSEGISWVGIQLTDGIVKGIGGDKGQLFEQKVGDIWMSKVPHVVGYVEDFESMP